MSGYVPAARYCVRQLTLTDFRCYGHLRLNLAGGPVVLSGPNGAGKTNILEALSLLVPGRGLRRARLSEIGRQIAGAATDEAVASVAVPWGVAARVETPDGAADLGTGFTVATDGGSERRAVRIDGENERNQAVLARHMSVHWLTPQMDRLFQDGASARRRFLDRLVFGWDPAHAGRVSLYEQAMRQRLKLLRGDRPADPAWLRAQEETMAARGIAVAAARADVVARLAGVVAENWGPFPGAAIAIDGEVDAWLFDSPALEAEDRFRARLSEDRDRDGRLGRTHTGPHLSDLLVRHQPKNEAAARCSTGEQKALLIALVLANARVRAAEDGGVPLLLLDEVAAHLDAKRRDALFDGLLGLGAQAWFAGTDVETFAGLAGAAQFYNVEDAQLIETPTAGT